MWVIRRKDDKFGIIWVYRKKDLPPLEEAHQSGFVGPDDELEIVNEDKEDKSCLT
jgi:hypothetical protein